MESVEEIFAKYGSYLENEQIIKDSISNETKSLDKISNNISVILEKLHNSVDDDNISETCSSIKLELKKAMDAFNSLQVVVPHDQFYRYNGLFKMSTQRLVMAVALLIYLSENRLVKFEEAASMLGLKIFSPDDPPNSLKNETSIENKSNEKMGISPDGIASTSEDNTDTPKIMQNKNDDLQHIVLPSGQQEGIEPIVMLSTSEKNTKKIVAPQSSGLLGTAAGSSLTEKSKLGQDDGSESVNASENSCCVATLTLANDNLQAQNSLPDTYHSLCLDLEDFLIGTLKIGSELARLSVNAVACGNFALPYKVNQFLRELHAGYTLLHLRNSYLRKTYDELKYSLKKTEDVVYNLSVRGLKPPSK